jgi:hypothetical protein
MYGQKHAIANGGGLGAVPGSQWKHGRYAKEAIAEPRQHVRPMI